MVWLNLRAVGSQNTIGTGRQGRIHSEIQGLDRRGHATARVSGYFRQLLPILSLRHQRLRGNGQSIEVKRAARLQVGAQLLDLGSYAYNIKRHARSGHPLAFKIWLGRFSQMRTVVNRQRIELILIQLDRTEIAVSRWN